LIKEWNTARTPDGRNLQVTVKDALDSVQPYIMPKDLTGVLSDPTSGMRMAQLQTDVLNQIAKDRKEGKNPYLRVTPGNPDFMLTEEKLKQGKYITSFLERIRGSQQRLTEKPGLPKTPEGGVTPELQRRPGESITDWQNRTGKGR
jgi:hypothetical protein